MVRDVGLPPRPRAKAELIERIDHWRGVLEGAVARFTGGQLTAPRGGGGWSVKDHLAHLDVWERSVLALLEGRPRREALGVDAAAWRLDIDALNEVIYQRYRDLGLEDVLKSFKEGHEEVMAKLRGLQDADLFKPYSHYQLEDPPYNAEPVMKWIAGDTYEHYMEHLAYLGV